MSRTDKDDPYWVRCGFYIPAHWRCTEDESRYGRDDPPRECDLPEFPVRHNPLMRRKFPWARACMWEPSWDESPRRWRYKTSSPPKWFLDHVWNNMERVRVRDSAILMRNEYNTTGKVEYEFQNFSHRHMAAWMWD